MTRLTARLAVLALMVAVLSRPSGAAAADLDEAMPFDRIVIIVEQDHTYDSYFRDFAPRPDAPRDGLVGLADGYVLFDNYYSSSPGGTLGNMLDLTTGSSHGLLYSSKESLAALGRLDVPTVFDRLNEEGVEWRLYDGTRDGVDRRKVLDGSYLEADEPTPPSLYRAPVLAMQRTWSEPDLTSRIVGQDQLFADVRSGALPPVSFVLPSPSDGADQGAAAGEARLLSIVNAITKSSQWEGTAIFVTWDDGGGQFDRATPPIGSGLRVPLLLISEYARHGYISHVEHDHLSLLQLVETRFGLEPLGTAASDNLATFEDAFDVTARRETLLGVGPGLPPTPVGTSTQNLRTVGLYAIGLSAAALVAVVGLARHGSARQKQRAI